MAAPDGPEPREVVIAGAGKAGELLLDCLDGDERWSAVAFLDEDKAGTHLLGLPVVHPDRYDPAGCAQAFMAIASPAGRRAFTSRLAGLGLRWPVFVDRRSHVSRAARVGEGTIVFPFASVGPGTEVGRFAYLGAYASVGKSAVLGDFVSLSPRASAGNCTVGEGCAIGFNSACLDGARLGDAVVLAPYTWVRKPVPSGSFVTGNPPRIRRRLP